MAKNELDITTLTPEQRDARLALDVERLLRFGRKHKLIKDLDILVARNTLLQIQQGVARHQNVQIFDELVFAAKAQQTLHVQCQACVALLRGQGCDVKFILCHDCPPVTVYAV